MTRNVALCLINVALAVIIGLMFMDSPPVAVGLFVYLVLQHFDDLGR
jgi:hypothetical protein